MALYCSVADKTKTVTKFYVSVSRISSIDGTFSQGVISTFNGSTFLSALMSNRPVWAYREFHEPSALRIIIGSPTNFPITLQISDNGEDYATLANASHGSTSYLNSWGIGLSQLQPGSYTITLSPTYSNITKQVTKLYGPVGGVTKRII